MDVRAKNEEDIETIDLVEDPRQDIRKKHIDEDKSEDTFINEPRHFSTLVPRDKM